MIIKKKSEEAEGGPFVIRCDKIRQIWTHKKQSAVWYVAWR